MAKPLVGRSIIGFGMQVGGIFMSLRVKGLDTATAIMLPFKKRNVKAAMDTGLKNVAEQMAMALQVQLASGSGTGHAEGTRRKYAMHKLRGAKWPSMPAYPSASPLHRSGALADSIAVAKEGNDYVVGVLEGRVDKFAGGGLIPLSDIASLQETGYLVQRPMTLRMHAYLKIIYKGGGSKGKRHLEDKQTGHMVKVWVPARSAWRRTFSFNSDARAKRWLNSALLPALGL